jgi:hypothetical protein
MGSVAELCSIAKALASVRAVVGEDTRRASIELTHDLVNGTSSDLDRLVRVSGFRTFRAEVRSVPVSRERRE